MGSLNNGLFGGFNGRVGNLVGYTLNGKSVIRTIGHSTKPLTPARKANCEEMTVINTFLRPIMTFIRVGFRLITAGTDKNFYNAAVSYNKKHAVQGEYPNIIMDYTKAMVSMGSLLKAGTTTISKHPEGIEFKWEVPADLPWRNRNDRAMLLIYFPDAGVSTYILSGSRRHVGQEVVAIDPNLTGSRMEAYISFIDEEATEISDSVHAGSLNHNDIENQQKAAPEKLKKPAVVQEKPKTAVAITATVKTQAPTPKKPTQQHKSFQWSSTQFNSTTPLYNYTFYAPPS
ncbi:DUF6266 family protein [Pedobacter gandavensis]|uniref:PRTRC system protein B n=1 Tax=Pedobacter gandavensis TaxID=2679963 RepID=A0ABR6F021_9SPHI|nr:DUF6266 family protein [Pedobacter gandavensis]MBB2150567.1 hypothetical protein [Pedobacter gandavensis]